MKFDLYSDFHSNHWSREKGTVVSNSVPERMDRSDIAIIAGDVSEMHRSVVLTVAEMGNYYKKVLFVDGNHHYYTPFFNENMREKRFNDAKDFGVTNSVGTNHVFLPFNYFLEDKVAVVGRNGWYDWNAKHVSSDVQKDMWKRFHSDYNLIDFYPYEGPHELAIIEARHLSEEIEAVIRKGAKQIVVVTHTIPHHDLPRFRGDPMWDNLTGSFINSYMEEVWEKYAQYIPFWVFGHTHEQIVKRMVHEKDGTEHTTMFLCNPLGYPHERVGKSKYAPMQFEVGETKNG